MGETQGGTSGSRRKGLIRDIERFHMKVKNLLRENFTVPVQHPKTCIHFKDQGAEHLKFKRIALSENL